MNLVCTVLLLAGWMEVEVTDAEANEPKRVVAATVGDASIFVHDVEREIARVVKDRGIDPAVRPFWLAKTLQQLVDRELILQWLARSEKGASSHDIDLERARLQRRVARRGVTWEAYLQQSGTSEPELRHVLGWQIAWSRFLRQYLVDENLQRFFDSSRRDFDGTRMRVAQILVAIAAPGDEPCQREAIAKAEQIRRQIVGGEMTFAEAARTFSSAPSANQGGDIGFMTRREPMPEAFSKAAFALDRDGVSDPVVTSFGVHLIHCLEIQAGQRSWQAARAEVEQSVIRYLFAWAADRGRKDAKVRFTGASPYFRSGTEEVILGEGENRTEPQQKK
ncbi:MAG: peptidylprolyl isomerase [Pirellulaceae bacterium]